MPTTHVRKPNANAYMHGPPNYVDGLPFAEGDALVVSSGSLNAAGVINGFEYLRNGRYQFEISGVQAGLTLQNVALGKLSTLSATGSGPLQWAGLSQFVNDGRVEVGSATAQGNLVYKLTDSFTVEPKNPTFTNTGAIVLQDASAFRLTHSTLSLGGSFLNAPGGHVSVASGSLFEQVLPSPSGFRDTTTRSDGTFRNDGTVVVNGTTGRGAALVLQTDVTGAGSYSVRGAPGDTSALIYARFERSASGAFYVSSGTLQFDGIRNTGDANATNVAAGSITFLDGNAVLDIDIGRASFATIPRQQHADLVRRGAQRLPGREHDQAQDPGANRQRARHLRPAHEHADSWDPIRPAISR